MTTSPENQTAKPNPSTIMTVGEAMVPTQAYQLPQFMLNSYCPDIGWRSESRLAAQHAIGLMMQAYGLAWIEMFDEHPRLQSVSVQVGSNGNISVDIAEGMDLMALDYAIGRINELCDHMILPFIEDLMMDNGLRREGLEEAISQSYDFIGRPMGLAAWNDAKIKRQSALEACLMEETTPQAGCGSRGPRL